jgi:hypothetical protein
MAVIAPPVKPRTLTRDQFVQTPTARRGGTYDRYLAYLAAHRKPAVAAAPAAAPAAAADPLAAFRPATDIAGEASRTVTAQTTPLISQINAEIDRRTREGQANIRGATSALATELAKYGPAAAAAYSGAEQSQTQVNEALANRLGALGGQVAAAAPTGHAAALGAVGTGAANAGYAAGSAETSRLIAERAASGDYGAKLPGIAALSGTQSARSLASQLEAERAQQVGDIRAKVPGLTVQTLADLRDREDRKAGTLLDYRTHQADVARSEGHYRQQRADSLAAAHADAVAAQQALALKVASEQADERYRYAALNSTNARAGASIEGQNMRTAAQITAQNRRTAATIAAAAERQRVAARIKADAKKKGGMTAGQYATLKGKAAKQAEVFRYGIPAKTVAGQPVPGTEIPMIPYGEALRRLTKQFSLKRRDAEAILDDFYAPGGEGGRRTPYSGIGFRGARLG